LLCLLALQRFDLGQIEPQKHQVNWTEKKTALSDNCMQGQPDQEIQTGFLLL